MNMQGEARNSPVALDKSEALTQTNVYFIYTSTEINTNMCAYMGHYKHTHFLAPFTKSLESWHLHNKEHTQYSDPDF